MTDTAVPLARYTFRRSVLEEPRTYSLYTDRIVIEGTQTAAQTYPLAEVHMVHLKYEHTKQRGYYQCFVQTKRGRISLHHLHWAGFAKFEDQRATYTPFVRALLAAVAHVPGVRFKAGSMMNFGCAIAGVPLMTFLAWLCFSMGRDGLGIFACVMGGIALLMIAPSRPRKFDPLSPPPRLLP